MAKDGGRGEAKSMGYDDVLGSAAEVDDETIVFRIGFRIYGGGK